MTDKTKIKTTKDIYPQIYAYTLPEVEEDLGWIKIGYTNRKNVDERILEQTKTAAIDLKYAKLWSEPAKYSVKNKWFTDKELHHYLVKVKGVRKRPKREWFYYDGTPERAHLDFDDFRNDRKEYHFAGGDDYQLRPEQEEAVTQTLAYSRSNPEGKFLWNAKPRFGKTLTAYDLALKMNADKVMIVTNRPAIANSWFDDYEKFIAEKSNYAFISTTDSLKNKPVMSRDDYRDQLMSDNPREKYFFFVSLQDLKGSLYFGGLNDKLDWVPDIDWDLLVIDESHEGVDTFKTEGALEQLKRKFTLYLSGTPFKAVASGEFTEDQIYNWTYADEQNAKYNWQNSEENNPYARLPRLNMFSYQMGQMITDEVNKGADLDGKSIDFTFDLNEFFSTKESGEFVHENDVRKWLDTLTRNEKYPFSTPELRNELKHTFWILNRVDSAKAMKRLLAQHPVFENYHIVLAAGDGRMDEDDQLVNSKAFDKVNQAIKEYDKTITLSVGQLTTGVTIPQWTAVLMLSNMKSPSLYMQAAFRSQNPWSFSENGQAKEKENAYVFDFAPERTLTIYDEFANNLSSKTTNGGGTSNEREKNIRELLNFFPVIAEDSAGKMVELDVTQVLTIPKAIKAQEVVRRGFMSNLLFQNISGIFASAEAREILNKLGSENRGKIQHPQDKPIETNGVEVDEEGTAIVDPDIVVSTTQARFGEKVYHEIAENVAGGLDSKLNQVADLAEQAFKNSVASQAKELAKESNVTVKQAERTVDNNAKEVRREVEKVQFQMNIDLNKLEREKQKKIIEAKATNNEDYIVDLQSKYEVMRQEKLKEAEDKVQETVATKAREQTEQVTKELLQQGETKKQNTVEDDIRGRLRGFARTIPSFLMAYGDASTTLATFDTQINDGVFEDVTVITLAEFRELRDRFNFFDETVFDESVKEFLDKKAELGNYFEADKGEDIFDYIPPQKTNQIYTPKWVVKMMIDKLEEENPAIFTDPDKTFADLYMKSGLYITELVKRLYAGLKDKIPDDHERLKHIMEKQVFGFAPTEIIYNIAKNYIFGFADKYTDISDSHIVLLDTTPYAKGTAEMSLEDKLDELFGGEK